MGETDTSTTETAPEAPQPAPKQTWRVKDTHGEAYKITADEMRVNSGVLEFVDGGHVLALFVTWSCMVRVA